MFIFDDNINDFFRVSDLFVVKAIFARKTNMDTLLQ